MVHKILVKSDMVGVHIAAMRGPIAMKYTEFLAVRPVVTCCAIFLAQQVASVAAGDVFITEYMYSGEDGEFFELTNTGPAAVDFTGWSFDDSHREPGAFDLSAFGIVAPGTSVIVTERDADEFRDAWSLDDDVLVIGELGVDFGNGLSRNDEINIYDDQQELVDRLTYGDEDFRGSIRTKDASGWVSDVGAGANDPFAWTLSEEDDVQDSEESEEDDLGSPGTHVAAAQPDPVADAPEFSIPGGLYTAAFDLTLESDVPDATIHYTLDGSVPDESSPIYVVPITIESNDGDPNVLSIIPTAPPEGYTPPCCEVFKATVLRAIVVAPGFAPSATITHTYFVDEDIDDRYQVPVLSVTTNRDGLFDYNDGIYVPGAIYDENFDPDLNWWNQDGNYQQRGRDWERPSHIEFFDTDGTLLFAQDVGVRIHGGVTRARPRKSIRFYARSDYGESDIDYPIWGDDAPDTTKRFLARTSGNDSNRTLFRDAMMQRLIQDTSVQTQASRPVVIFLNGEYWGIHNLRERYDDHLIERTYGYEEDEIDFLTGNSEVEIGDATHYEETLEFIDTEDLNDPDNWAWVNSRINVENYITYVAAEVFYRNDDWPQNNIDFWRPRTPDGRWEWLMFDTDVGFGRRGGHDAYLDNSLARIAVELDGWPTQLFQGLLQSDAFVEAFITRYADLMNTNFESSHVLSTINAMAAEIESDIPEHSLRWTTPGTISEWNSDVNVMRGFAMNRPGTARQHVVGVFDLAGMIDVTLSNPVSDEGRVVINTINDLSTTDPWTGVYFQDVPITLSAIAEPGMVFSHWTGTMESADNPLVVTLTEDAVFEAVFSVSADLDGDGIVGFADLAIVLSQWDDDGPADLDGDGVVGLSDLLIVLAQWGL